MWKTVYKMMDLFQGQTSVWSSKFKKRANLRTLLCESLESRQLFAVDATFGMYKDRSWKLCDNPAAAISFGLPGDQPVTGDWNEDEVVATRTGNTLRGAQVYAGYECVKDHMQNDEDFWCPWMFDVSSIDALEDAIDTIASRAIVSK